MRYIPKFGSRAKIEVLVPDPAAKSIIIDDVLKHVLVLLLLGRYLSMMLRKLMILEANKPGITPYRIRNTSHVTGNFLAVT
ncbi:MAG: hypothetical protein WA364_11735 [Candidatus Nitrosopolaris sp.]